MICTNCGAQNASGARFCGSCGAKMEPEVKKTPAKTGLSGAQGFLKANRKLIGMIAAVLAVVLLFSMVFGGRGYKKTVNKFMDSLLDMDAKGMIEMMPDKLLKTLMEEEGYTKKELIEELQDELDYGMSYMEMIDDLKLKHKIVGAEDMSKEDLRYLKDMYSEIGIKVSAAKVVEVELTVKAMGMTQSETLELMVIKIGRSWYIEMESLENFF